MNCPICKTDITHPEQQFGQTKIPICQSCFLNDDMWATEDEEILGLLQEGRTLQEASHIVQVNFWKELEAQ